MSNQKDPILMTSSISSATSSQSTSLYTNYQQSMQDFSSLKKALQSGDLSSAQSAFDSWQKDIQNNPQMQNLLSSSNSQTSQDFQSLQGALQSGDLSSAQKAFAALQQDMKSSQVSGHHHHRHHHNSSESSSTAVTGTTNSAGSSTLNATA